MKIKKTKLQDVITIMPQTYQDHRGFFFESFNRKKYSEIGIKFDFVQDNYSQSCKGVLRGLHFQKNKPQGKLVRVSRGKVYDVAVDIRQGSPTFGQWESIILSEDNIFQVG